MESNVLIQVYDNDWELSLDLYQIPELEYE